MFLENWLFLIWERELAHTPSIASQKCNNENTDDKFLKIVKNITSKGLLEAI